MNCPWFLKPADASLSFMPAGSIVVIFASSCGFDEIFCAIGFSVAVFGPDTFDMEPAGLPVVNGFPDVVGLATIAGLPVVVGLLPCCAVAGPCESAYAGVNARHAVARPKSIRVGR